MNKLLHEIKKAIISDQSLQEAVNNASDLKEAMVTRQIIGRAKSILIERHHFSQDEALRQLQRSSHDSNLTLKEVAQDVIEANEN